MLLRVGADSKYGGFHSPIFSNQTYKFIPIPDFNVVAAHRIEYRDYLWGQEHIIDYIPDSISAPTHDGNKIAGRKEEHYNPWFVHDDPEYRTCTYGSPKHVKGGAIEKNYKKLLSLEGGDLLVFYAAFSAIDVNLTDSLSGYYIFAYFVIENKIEYENPNSLSNNLRNRIQNNHHYLHGWSDQIVVTGDKKQSRVFKKAVLLSLKSQNLIGSNYYPCKFMRDLLMGYNKALNLSSLRSFESTVLVERLKNHLDEASEGNLIDTF